MEAGTYRHHHQGVLHPMHLELFHLHLLLDPRGLCHHQLVDKSLDLIVHAFSLLVLLFLMRLTAEFVLERIIHLPKNRN
jgi:hypothetical protein